MSKASSTSQGLTAVILAGGLGARLRPVIADRPKVLAPVAGRPFAHYLLDRLARAGCAKVVMSTGRMADQVEAALGRDYQGLPLAYSRESSPLDTGGAVALALPMVGADPFFVLNGDSLAEADLVAFTKWFTSRPRLAAILLARVPDRGRFGGVALAPDGRVEGFIEKGDTGAGLINAGVYLLRRKAFADEIRNGAFSLETRLFPHLARQGELWGWPGADAFIDIGTPESYAAAQTFPLFATAAPPRTTTPGEQRQG